MKADGLLKHAAVAFGIALVLYGTAYTWIEHQRARRGPWRVTFANDQSGAPSILINQPGLAITNVLISFQREPPLTNGSPAELVFSEDMMREKLDYIHANPVKRGYVDRAEHWRYSSARNYAGETGLIEVDRWG